MRTSSILENVNEGLLDELYEGLYITDLNRNILFWNKAAEKLTGFSKSEVKGRSCRDNILNHVDAEGNSLCKGMCPLAFSMEEGKGREAEVFLHHRDGHRVPVHVRVSPIHDSNGNIVGGIEIFGDNSGKLELLQSLQAATKESLTDPLTGVANRKCSNTFLDSCLNEHRRFGFPFGTLMIDIDNFKKVNDTYSHNMGDKVIKMVASTLAANVRSFDLVGRWGGEEFVVILKNVDATSLYIKADMLRRLVEQAFVFDGETKLQVTFSGGITLSQASDTIESNIGRADANLYRSKHFGKNRITAD